MMDQNEYLTIKEFAEVAGVSTQSVYKRLATSLQPYVKEVANQKVLNIQALQDVYGIEVGNSCKPKRQEVVNGCKPKNEEKAYQEEQIKSLTDKVYELEIRLDEKESLIKEKDAHILDLRSQVEHLKKEVELLHEDLQIEKKSNLLLVAQKNEEMEVLEDQKRESWWHRWFK
jgi:predicted RNase H-like nuclease (RuvC/YqgF family)